MDAEELLSLMTLGAVAPYILVALPCWLRRLTKSAFGAHAPTWVRLQGTCTHSA